MSSLSTGLSGLLVSQRLIDLTGQNLTNANTPGYHRQVADLAALNFGQPVGNGVAIQRINRPVDGVLEEALLQNSSESGNVSAQLNSLQQAQGLLSPSQGKLSDLLGNFFDAVEQLTATPDDLTQRSSALSAATNLTQNLNYLANNVQQIRGGLDARSVQDVQQANNLTAQIAQLNTSIQGLQNQGASPNDLMDQRAQDLTQLAGLMDVRTVDLGNGVVNVIAGGVAVVAGSQSVALKYQVASSGQARLVPVSDQANPLSVTGGTIGGDLQARNQLLPGLSSQLNSLTQSLIQNVDEAHATGLNLDGPSTLIAGSRAVTDPTVPLAQAGLQFPPTAGSLFVSVTNLATGARTLNQIAIDPATQSLHDVANSLSTINHVQAVVDPQTNTLRILAQPGYGVDFAGQIPSTPDQTAISGTTSVQIGGTYSGSSNDEYTYQVSGNGTVGVTPNLNLEVRNQAGTLLGTFNIGAGYVPGSSLTTVNGVTVSLASGTVVIGDHFSVPVTAQPDSAGILSALGLNSFFTGDNAGNIAVRQDLLDHPDLLNASTTGQAGDGSNLVNLAALRDSPLLTGNQTFEQFAGTIIAGVGSQVQNLTQQQAAQQTIGQNLQAQQQSVSGVDTNEELANLLQYQQAFQLSAHFISTVSTTLNSLLGLLPVSNVA